MKGNAGRGHTVDFGSYGLKSLDSHWITNRQIESARVALTRYMKREGICEEPKNRKPKNRNTEKLKQRNTEKQKNRKTEKRHNRNTEKHTKI